MYASMYVEEGGRGIYGRTRNKRMRGDIPREGAGEGGAGCHETVARRTDSSVEPNTDREHV